LGREFFAFADAGGLPGQADRRDDIKQIKADVQAIRIQNARIAAKLGIE